jgi:hypothetical protein
MNDLEILEMILYGMAAYLTLVFFTSLAVLKVNSNKALEKYEELAQKAAKANDVELSEEILDSVQFTRRKNTIGKLNELFEERGFFRTLAFFCNVTNHFIITLPITLPGIIFGVFRIMRIQVGLSILEWKRARSEAKMKSLEKHVVYSLTSELGRRGILDEEIEGFSSMDDLQKLEALEELAKKDPRFLVRLYQENGLVEEWNEIIDSHS